LQPPQAPAWRPKCDLALLPAVLLAGDLHLHALAGQGAFDEDHLADRGVAFRRAVRDALRFEIERFDLEPFET
jgi:hypothetical protein